MSVNKTISDLYILYLLWMVVNGLLTDYYLRWSLLVAVLLDPSWLSGVPLCSYSAFCRHACYCCCMLPLLQFAQLAGLFPATTYITHDEQASHTSGTIHWREELDRVDGPLRDYHSGVQLEWLGQEVAMSVLYWMGRISVSETARGDTRNI